MGGPVPSTWRSRYHIESKERGQPAVARLNGAATRDGDSSCDFLALCLASRYTKTYEAFPRGSVWPICLREQ